MIISWIISRIISWILSWPKAHKSLMMTGCGWALVATLSAAASTQAWTQQQTPPQGAPTPAKSAASPASPAAPPPAKPASRPAKNEPSAKNETPAVVLNDEDVTSVLSQPVFSDTGENMGHIVDVLIDRKADIRAVVIDFGGFLGVGSRKVAVDWHALRFPAKGKLDRMILSLSRKKVQLAPEYKPGEPIVVLGGSANAAPVPVAPTATSAASSK